MANYLKNFLYNITHLDEFVKDFESEFRETHGDELADIEQERKCRNQVRRLRRKAAVLSLENEVKSLQAEGRQLDREANREAEWS